MMPPQLRRDDQPAFLPSVARVPGILRHLIRLSESFTSDDEPISFIHIYSQPNGSDKEAPLRFIRAAESGPEGIACVDDVARAALLALEAYKQLRVPATRRLACAWLDFVAYMQEPDGRFTNFIVDRAGRKKRTGQTSYPGGIWWTTRAQWALTAGWRLTGDDRYGDLLMASRVAGTGNLKVTAMQALVLMERYAIRPSPSLRLRILDRCDRIMAGGPGYFRDRKDKDTILLWGYHQLQAMARAGRLFSHIDYLSACERTVHYVVEPLILRCFTASDPWQRSPRCAYDLSTIMLGLEELFLATHSERYRQMALACADWLSTGNSSGHPLYNSRTGRCADGVVDGIISPNCGAESAIEAGFMELSRRRLRA